MQDWQYACCKIWGRKVRAWEAVIVLGDTRRTNRYLILLPLQEGAGISRDDKVGWYLLNSDYGYACGPSVNRGYGSECASAPETARGPSRKMRQYRLYRWIPVVAHHTSAFAPFQSMLTNTTGGGHILGRDMLQGYHHFASTFTTRR
jgi:hypothetical protein